MLALKIVLWAVGLFVAYHSVIGFMDGLGFKRRPRLRVVRWENDQEEEDA